HWILPDRTLTVSRGDVRPARGQIQAAAPNGIRMLHLEGHLGLAVDGGEVALGTYLRRVIASGGEVSAETLAMDGMFPTRIRVVVAPRQSQVRREWILDGERGWMIESSKSIVGP